jgi:UDP-N-acetylmuramate dehydrogenase
MQIEENKPLAPLTTIGVGGPARWYVRARDEAEILESVEWTAQRGVPLFVLGGGSNLLVSDSGFPGLVLHPELKGIRTRNDGQTKIYEVAAGEDWDHFVQLAVDDGCSGIECLAGIPGTVGGTPVQNVGAYGQEVSSSIKQVRAFDLNAHSFVEFTAEECGFAYRRSRFNSTDRGRYLVTRVDYRLTPGGMPTLRYPDLQRAIAANGAGARTGDQAPTLAEVAAAVRALRNSKGMLLVDGDGDCRSAGSFFKNPVVTTSHAAEIAAKSGKEPPQFAAGTDADTGDLVKIPAAWLIEQAGFSKGYRLGAAGISSRHTLALVNLGDATAQEILALAAQISEAVETRFGIQLEREPVLVGFD